MKRYLQLFALAVLLVGCSQAPEPAGDPSKASSSAPEAEASAPEAVVSAPGADEPCRVAPPAEPVMCTADWNPVCGCDGKTYANACNAGAAGVTRFEPGECEKKDRL